MHVKVRIPVVDIKLLNTDKERVGNVYLVYDKEKFKQFIENKNKRIIAFFGDKLPLENELKDFVVEYNPESLVAKLEELEEKGYNLSIGINLGKEFTISVVGERRSDGKPYYGIIKFDISEDDLILKED